MRLHRILPLIICSSFLYFTGCREAPTLPAAPPGISLFGDETNDVGSDIIEMEDGNFLILGGIQDKSSLEYDIALIKVDRQGRELWTRVLEDDSRDEYGFKIRKTPNGYGVISFTRTGGYNGIELSLNIYSEDFQLQRRVPLANPSGSFYGGDDPIGGFYVTQGGDFLIELLSYDNTHIQRVTAAGVREEGTNYVNQLSGQPTQSLFPSHDGGYVLATTVFYGSTSTRFNFFDADGFPKGSPLDWTPTSPGQVIAGTYLQDGTYLVLMRFWDYSSQDIFAVQVDTSGNFLQQIDLRANGDLRHVFLTESGGIVMAGNTFESYDQQNNNIVDGIISYMDTLGGTQTTTNIGGDVTDKIQGIVPTSDGGFAIAGFTRSWGAGGSDIFVTFYQP